MASLVRDRIRPTSQIKWQTCVAPLLAGSQPTTAGLRRPYGGLRQQLTSDLGRLRSSSAGSMALAVPS